MALKLRATRPRAHRSLNDSSCAPAHNTPLPLERSPPASFKRMLGCRKTKTGGPPRLKAPTRHRLLTYVMIPERAIIPAGSHATVLETGGPSGMDRDRSGLPFQKAPCRREPPAGRASRGFRSGNPRRRLLVGSKGVE